MKCEDIKNLIRESADLDLMSKDHNLSTHLEECKSCQSFFNYEKSLRKSFSLMADEAPPAQLAAKIFAIPTQNSGKAHLAQSAGFKQFISSFFADFPLKTAFVSCLIGFLAAIMLQNQAEIVSIENKTKVTRSHLATETIAPPLNDNEKSLLFAQAKSDLTTELIVPEETKEELSVRKRKVSDEHIPGAISFSIADKNAVALETRGNIQSQVSSHKPRALVPMIRQDEKACLAKSDSNKIDSFSVDSLIETDSVVSPKATAPDPRNAELESLLTSYAVPTERGFLNLRNLAARGIIEATRLEHFSPPPGMNWFVEIESGKTRVFLKKEK